MQIARLLNAVKKDYPDAVCALHFKNPLEMLIATMLSAQCTDKKVNEVTATLFRKYKTARDYAEAPIKELEQDVRSTGFYRNKAKNIKATCQILVEKYRGNVPRTMEQLLELPGVARKTANIVLENSFGHVEGIAVDTHVKKFALKTGLSSQQNTDKIEQDLMRQIPKKDWFSITYCIIEHGRQCTYKKPGCNVCRFVKEF